MAPQGPDGSTGSSPLPGSPRRVQPSARAWVLVVALVAIVGMGFSPAHALVVPSTPVGHASPPDLGAAARPANSDPFGLAVDDQVDVVASSLNVHRAPSVASTVTTVEVQFHQGIIVAGSVLADGYHWWEVSWDDNYTGWSADGSNGTAWIQNLTGHTVAFSRSAALAYAAEYWDVVTSDGYFWNGPDSYVQYAQGTSVVGLSGDDCAHFVSQVIGDEPHQAGGGLNIPSRVPPTYGEPSAPDLGNMILNNGWGIQVNGTDQLEVGDVINYEWNPPDGTWDHIAVYLGNGEVAAHTDSNYGTNWTLGGAYAYRFIHILATTQGGSGVDHPEVSLSISPTSGPAPLTVTATATVVGGSETYPSYFFTWGDGTTSTSATPTATHTYASSGTYSVTVRVTDSLGATGWANNQTLTVSSGSPPSLSVALSAPSTTGTSPMTVAFTAAATGGSGTYVSYAWSFGDGVMTTTTAPAASHTYTGMGTFSATVSVTDSSGAVATSAAVLVTVSAPASPLAVVISSGSTSGTEPLSVSFTATPSGGTGTYSSFTWSFGDGSTQTTTVGSVSHSYDSVGVFGADVVVSDGSSQATSNTLAITVSASSGGTSPPLAATLSASSESGTAPLSTVLSLQVSGGTAPYRVDWNFDDGSTTGWYNLTGSTTSLTHSFTGAGTYVVTATVTDSVGHLSSASVTVVSQASAPSTSSPTPSAAPSPFASVTSGWALYAILGLAGAAVIAGAVIVRRHRRPPAASLEASGPDALYAPWPPPPG